MDYLFGAPEGGERRLPDKTSHERQSNEVTQMAADFVQLDRVLALRPGDQGCAGLALYDGRPGIWIRRSRTYHSGVLDNQVTTASANVFFEKIQQLEPRTDFQRTLYAQAMQIGAELVRLRSLLLEQTGGSIRMAFLIVLVFWLAMLFTSFGLFAPSNATVIGVLFDCAIWVAGAIFLVLEIDRPFEGLIQISRAPATVPAADYGTYYPLAALSPPPCHSAQQDTRQSAHQPLKTSSISLNELVHLAQ